uniref:Uncharacterized protein n=1 Tax=Romanomermis culicivorax TaxID=13658 RepID=A0A915L5G9_ROMCU
MNFWLFNVTNPDEILLRGEKPSLVRKGPYSFDEYQEKTVENDTENFIIYRNFKRYVFNRTSSCDFCDLDDTFVVPNVPYLTAVNTLNNMPNMSNIVQSIFHVTLLAIGEHPFTAQKARFLLFEGYKDALFSLLQWLKYLPQFRDVPDRMGFFYPKNETDDGTYKIYSGRDTVENLGKIMEWNGDDRLRVWNSDLCNKIKGSDGSLFPPFVSKTTILKMFVSDICRSIYATFHSEVDVLGIRAYRFVIPRSTSDSKNPENEGFCQPTDQIFYPNSQPLYKNSTSYCLPSGLLNSTKCRFGAPVVVSNPNFMFSPQEVFDSVDGLSKPNVKDDSSFLDIEPNTGAVLGVQRKLQVNVAMYNIGRVLRYLKPVIVPVLMINESAKIGDEFHDYLYKSFVTGPSLAHGFGYVFLVFGLLGSTATVLILVGLRRRRNRVEPELEYNSQGNDFSTSQSEISSSAP